MKYLGRLLMTVFVLTCFTTLQVQAGTDAVIRFVGSQTDDVSVSNGQPVITFFPTGVKLSGSSVVLPYKSFKNISFGVARSSITVFDDGNISDR